MDIVVQGIPKVGELRKIILPMHCVLKFFQVTVEHPGKGPAGRIPHHRDIHGDEIPLKGGVPAALDGIPQALPRFLPKAVHVHDLVLMPVKPIDIHVGVNPPFTDEFLQSGLGQSFDVHGFLAGKMHELAQASGLTALVIAEQGLSNLIFSIFHGTALMDAGRFPTAGAPFRNCLLHGKTAAVQIFLHMGDDHVPLADQYPAAGHQLHPLDKGKVVQACPGYPASVYLHRLKNCHR